MSGHVPAGRVDVIRRAGHRLRRAHADEAARACVCGCRPSGRHSAGRRPAAQTRQLHHSGGAEVEQRLHGLFQIGIANVIERDAVPHFEIVRMLDVVIEHLCEEQQRLVRRDRKSVAGRQLRREHSLRQCHES